MPVSPGGLLIRKPRIYPYGLFEEAGYSTGTTPQGTAITPSSSAHTKGSYTQLIASTARQVRTMVLSAITVPAGANSKSYLVDVARSATVTISIASPGVITWAGHGLAADSPVVFTTSGALPTGLTAGTTYFVIATGLTGGAFSVAATVGGAAINTSGSQSGTHTAYFNLIPNLCIAAKSQFNVGLVQLRLPMNIAPGTRLAARCQTQAASGEACHVKAVLEDGTVGMQGVDSLNASTTTTLGTSVTPGNATESSYVQLIASTARQYEGFFATFDPQGASGGNFPFVGFDIAIGGAGSEVVFLQNFMVFDSSGLLNPCNTPYVPFPIPVGSRIAVRARGNGASNAIGVSGYGVW